MKKIICVVFALLLGIQSAYADACGTSLTGVFTANQATKLCNQFRNSSNYLDNNAPLYGLDAAGTPIPLLKIDGNEETFLNADATEVINLSVAMTPEAIVSNDKIAFTGTSATLQGAGGIIVNVDADPQRLFTFDASSDTANTLTWGDAGVTAAQRLSILASTADADDDSTLVLAGGGAFADSRGAYTIWRGNESSGAGGTYQTSTGDVAGADLLFTAKDDLIIEQQGGTDSWSHDTTTGDTSQLLGNIIFSTAGKYVQMAAAVPTMAATPVAGTNDIYAGLNIVPTAAANTAAMFAATPVVGTQYQIFNSGPNSVRIKGGGATTINGATAGGYVVMATLTNAYCVVTSASNINCSVAPAPTPAGP